MDRRELCKVLVGYFCGACAADRGAHALSPAQPPTVPLSGAFQSAGALKVNAGVLTVLPGTRVDQRIDVGFRPAVIIFFSAAEFYKRTLIYAPSLPIVGGQRTTGSAQGVCMGAFDGTNQWSQQHAVTFADGRRDGYLWRDAVYDAGEDLGGGTNNLGAKLVGKSISDRMVTLGVERAPQMTDGPVTMNWIAIGGCHARVGTLNVPQGEYHTNPPQRVAVRSLPFRPTGLIFAPWRQTNSGAGGSSFFTATAGSAIGFASAPIVSQQAAVGSSNGYDGHIVSFAYQGCVAGASRQDHADNPTYLATLNRFTEDGFLLDFQSADDSFPNDALPYVALDCACYAGQASMLLRTGDIDITGADFSPVAGIFGAVPSVEENYTKSWSPLGYATNGDENTSFGFAVNSSGTVKQNGISFFDKAGYDASGRRIVVNGRESSSTASHDARFLTFENSIIKGQSRTNFQSFSLSGELTVARFLKNGVRLNQRASSGRAGKIAFMLVG
jgi:hypothetical protein